jgi:uncharacterized protein YbaP (TraB family)
MRKTPILFALTFLALPFSAQAQPLDPAQFDYTPNPAVWKLSDADTTIYMLGTVHALHEKVKWRSPALNRIIAEVDELVLESVKEKDDEFIDDQMAAAMLAGLERKPLIDRVAPENRDILKQVVRQTNVPMDYLDLVPTWMVAFALFYGDAHIAGVSPELGVESVLEKTFAKAKKPVGAIEDPKAVDASLNALSEEEQLIALDEMLTEIRTSPATSLLPDKPETEAPFADDIAWAKGDISGIGKDMTPESMGKAYYKALLVDRNTAWADWLQKRLAKPGKLLLAVGSAHLAGKDSVQVLLESKGLKVERIH